MVGQRSEWLQVNVSLVRRDGSALPSARPLFRSLEAALPAWRRRRIVSRFFFQRKAPDVRLRFHGQRNVLVARLRPVFSRMKVEGHVGRSFYSVYEPEERRFGGRECMRHVHAYWDADSLAWIALDRLFEAGTFRIAYPDLMAAILNDLFWRMLGDGDEIWDTWCNLVVLLRSKAEAHGKAGDPVMLEPLAAQAADVEVAILDRYRQANGALAEGLLHEWSRGRMRSGMRAILSDFALFTLNRHGFDQTKAAAVACAMAAAWNPHQHLRGGHPEPPQDAARARMARDAE
jgi:thiopeptide-type bacteriocin biosynthesis protein